MPYDSRTMLCQESDDEFSADIRELRCGHKPGVGFTPITEYSKLKTSSPCNVVLDWIAGATEEGYLNAGNYLEMTFKKKGDWGKFLEDLSQYEFWLNERHAYGFAELLECSPDDFITYQGLAEELSEQLN